MQPSPPAAKVTSPWAVASLMCSAVIVCPLATVLGPLLGVKAIADIRARPGLKGTPLAVLGIVLGLLMSVIWISAAIWLNVAVRQPILAGPAPELAAGFRGDVAGFKDGFVGDGSQADDAIATAFINELTRRYGPLHSIEHDANAPPPDEDAPPTSEYIVPYVLHFERSLVQAEAAFVPFDQMKPVGKWRWIVIKDDELGDMRYPPPS